ncbi:hypothetical protein BDD12DRAFT_897034 [Trichophaea hybrida]|nr:hypothetical protein BDD12DRAFT_897034 [Trichophaea hybrida]
MTSPFSSPHSTAPSTPPSPITFKTILYHPSTYALPPAHIATLRSLINTAFTATEGPTFPHPRIPDSEAQELLTPGRWIFCLYSPRRVGLPAAKDHAGVVHELDGWGLVGTVSLSNHEEEEWHINLLATSLEYPKAGIGARLLEECERFVRDEREGKVLVAMAIEKFGLGLYYQKRGFREEEAGKVRMPVGAWGSTEGFTLVKMVKVI